jgi:hypothetical protein
MKKKHLRLVSSNVLAIKTKTPSIGTVGFFHKDSIVVKGIDAYNEFLKPFSKNPTNYAFLWLALCLMVPVGCELIYNESKFVSILGWFVLIVSLSNFCMYQLSSIYESTKK